MGIEFGISTLQLTGRDELGKLWQMHHLLALQEDEFQRCKQACESLLSYRGSIQMFLMIEWNYEDYQATYQRHLNAHIKKDIATILFRPANLDLNRALLNCLASIRMYLDHIETYTKEKYGKNSPNAETFLRECSRAYDESFSYRFLYSLRNYTQHYGMPLTVVDFRARIDGDKSHHELVVGVERDKLLAGKFDLKKIRQDLATQPQVINVTPHIEEMMNRLKNIHIHFLADELGSLREDAAYLKEVLDKIPSGYDGLYLVKTTEKPDSRLGFTLQHIPVDLVNDISNVKS